MKPWHWITLVLCFVSVSCVKTVEYDSLPDKRPEFRSVYGLKDSQPDSALLLFNRIADTLDETALQKCSDFLFFEYQVLKAEVYYRNHCEVHNDSSVLAACDFYESKLSRQRALNRNKDLAFQYARACYYKAVVEERTESTYVQPFSDYLKALWIMDGLANKRHVISIKKENLEFEHFTGLIYDRLAWFFYNHDLWDDAMECLAFSNECFASENYLEGIASNFEMMGDVMLAQEQREASVVYYRKSDSINELLQKDSDDLKFSGLVHRGITLSSAGDKKRARDLLLQGLEHPNRPWMEHRIHFSLGYIYYDLQEYDSALYHYEHSYPLLPRQTARSYCRIIELANRLGETEKAASYGELLAKYYTELVKQRSQNARLVALFEGYKSDSKDVRNKDCLYFILAIIIFLASVIVIDSVFLHRRKRHHKREIEQHEKIKASLENEIETTRKAARRKEEEVKELEIKLQKVVSNPSFQNLPFDKKMETLFEMPICKRVCMVKESNVKAGSSYPELVLSEKQMRALVNAVDSVFPKFSVKLMEQYPRMKWSDMVYCCMYVLGITEVQAAALTGKTYQAVWTRSVKLHEIFENKSNLQFFLHDFLKVW